MSNEQTNKSLDIRSQKRARHNSPVLLERCVRRRVVDPYNSVSEVNLSNEVETSRRKIYSRARRIEQQPLPSSSAISEMEAKFPNIDTMRNLATLPQQEQTFPQNIPNQLDNQLQKNGYTEHNAPHNNNDKNNQAMDSAPHNNNDKNNQAMDSVQSSN